MRRAAADNTTKERTGTTDRVYAELRHAILNLQLAPGSNLDELDFVARLNVSRTPIREAFLRLARDGLVTHSPNRGACVSSLELSRAREFFEALEISQRVVTRWAALRRTGADLKAIDDYCIGFEAAARNHDLSATIEANIGFHRAIGIACHNSYILDEYCHLLTLGSRFSRLALHLTHDECADVDAAIEEHRQMIESIKTQDAERADLLARGHVTLFRNHVLSALCRSSAAELDFSVSLT